MNTYDIISDTFQSDQQRFLPSTNLSSDGQLMTVTYFTSPTSTHPDTLSRTLKTFSHMPMTNSSGNESSTMMIARLAEQEVIEV
jgi:hypothetical protein